MIEIRGVNKRFNNFLALEDINIDIKKGTIHGIIGENGAGKTTLLQMLAGVYSVDEGSILVDGEEIFDNNEIKQKIGYVADRNQYFKDYRVRDMMKFYLGIYESFSEERFHKYNRIFKLDVDKKVKQLSKGMQMRLSLMLNLSISPEILILDEPTSGLDAIVKKELVDILIEEINTRDTTIIISSHYIGELEKICDEVTILNQGKVKYASNVDELKENIKKLQVVFNENVDEKIKSIESIINIEKIGSVYYIVTDNYGEKILEDLEEIGAERVENVGITLEEIFIYTNKNLDWSEKDE